MPDEAPGRFKAFAIGSAATLGFYAFFYLRNPEAVLEHIRLIVEEGPHAVVLSVVSLVVITVGSGFWTVFNKPVSSLAAATLGLGAPGALTAATLGGAEAPHPGAPEARLERPAPIQAGVVAAFLPAWVSDSLALVVSPVSVVRAYERQEVQEELNEAVAEQREAVEALARVEREREALSVQVQELRHSSAALARVEAELAGARERLAAAMSSDDELRERIASLDRSLGAARRAQADAQEKARSLALTLRERDRKISGLERDVSSLNAKLQSCSAARRKADRLASDARKELNAALQRLKDCQRPAVVQ
jgi:hypothetical protein